MQISVQCFANATGGGVFQEPRHLLGLALGKPHPVQFAVDGAPGRRLGMKPGDLQIMPAGLLHEANWTDASFLLAMVPEAALDGMAAELELADPKLQPRMQHSDPLIQQLLVSLANESLDEQPAGALRREQLELALLGQLLGCHSGLTRGVAQRSSRQLMRRHTLAPRRLRQVLEYIEVFCHTPISVDELAAIAGVSRYHFVRGFKASTGESPYQMVIRRRLERAVDLLEGSQLPVGMIAYRLGFSSQSHFSQAFRQRYGISLQGYRRQLL